MFITTEESFKIGAIIMDAMAKNEKVIDNVVKQISLMPCAIRVDFDTLKLKLMERYDISTEPPKFSDFLLTGKTLWSYNGKYFVLYSKGTTPNNCWLIGPQMREILDISANGANYKYGNITYNLGEGTVPASYHSTFY